MKPNKTIMRARDRAVYLRRWHLIPRNRWVNIFVHAITLPDSGRAIHNHPWPFFRVILWGSYDEDFAAIAKKKKKPVARRVRWGGGFGRRSAHRITKLHRRRIWSLIFTGPGGVEGDWGFFVNGRFTPSADYPTGNISVKKGEAA